MSYSFRLATFPEQVQGLPRNIQEITSALTARYGYEFQWFLEEESGEITTGRVIDWTHNLYFEFVWIVPEEPGELTEMFPTTPWLEVNDDPNPENNQENR